MPRVIHDAEPVAMPWHPGLVVQSNKVVEGPDPRWLGKSRKVYWQLELACGISAANTGVGALAGAGSIQVEIGVNAAPSAAIAVAAKGQLASRNVDNVTSTVILN